jgi:hypothetical protein
MSEGVREVAMRDLLADAKYWEQRYHNLIGERDAVKQSIAYITDQEYKAAKLAASELRYENDKLKRLLLAQLY